MTDDRSDYYKAQLSYAQRLEATNAFINREKVSGGGEDPTMKNRQRLWMNTFSGAWAKMDYNSDYAGYAMKLADESLEAFDARFCRVGQESFPGISDTVGCEIVHRIDVSDDRPNMTSTLPPWRGSSHE